MKFCGVATRFEKTARNYRAIITLAGHQPVDAISVHTDLALCHFVFALCRLIHERGDDRPVDAGVLLMRSGSAANATSCCANTSIPVSSSTG
jgi:hypothetical protein